MSRSVSEAGCDQPQGGHVLPLCIRKRQLRLSASVAIVVIGSIFLGTVEMAGCQRNTHKTNIDPFTIVGLSQRNGGDIPSSDKYTIDTAYFADAYCVLTDATEDPSLVLIANAESRGRTYEHVLAQTNEGNARFVALVDPSRFRVDKVDVLSEWPYHKAGAIQRPFPIAISLLERAAGVRLTLLLAIYDNSRSEIGRQQARETINWLGSVSENSGVVIVSYFEVPVESAPGETDLLINELAKGGHVACVDPEAPLSAVFKRDVESFSAEVERLEGTIWVLAAKGALGWGFNCGKPIAQSVPQEESSNSLSQIELVVLPR